MRASRFWSKTSEGFIAILYSDGTVRFLEWVSGRHLRSTKVYIATTTKSYWPSRTIFSPQCLFLASAHCERDGDSTISIHKLSNGTIARQLDYPGKVQFLCFSPDKPQIAVVGQNGEIRVWDWEEERLKHTIVWRVGYLSDPDLNESYGTLSVTPERVSSLAFSPDGLFMAGNGESEVYVWDIATWTLVRTLEISAVHIEFSPDGRHLALGEDNGVSLWNTLNWSLAHAIRVANAEFEGFAFSLNGQFFAATDYFGKMWVWEIETAAVKLSVRFDSDEDAYFPMLTPLFHSEGTSLIAGDSNAVYQWAIEDEGIRQPPIRLTSNSWAASPPL